MSKVLKIAVSIIGLSLFYLWMSSVFQSCQNKKNTTDDIALVNDTLDDGEELLENIDEESFEDDEIDYSEEGSKISDNEFVEFDDSAKTSSSTTTSSKSTPSKSTSNYSSNSRGQYLVISGNYLVDTNAEKMRSKLKSMGFSNAEIAVFNGSNYQTVIANRYSDYNEALRAASTLKEKGVDSYVKKKS
jgi:hypothetical protein